MALSPTAMVAALAQETSEREVCLLTITHPAWTEPILLSTDATEFLRYADDGSPMYGTKSRGQVFEFVPIQPILPDSHDEQAPTARVSIDNVSQLVAPYLRMVDDTPPRVTVEVVLASSPDIVDQIWPEMELTQASIDASRAEVTLGMDIGSNEAIPWLRFIPAHFPNLFD